MKKIIIVVFIIALLVVLLTTVMVYAFAGKGESVEKEIDQTKISVENRISEEEVDQPKISVENRISEEIPGQINQSSRGLIKLGVVSDMVTDIEESGMTIQDIQTVYPEIEIKPRLGIRGYGNILDRSVKPRLLNQINDLYPVEYINKINEKTIYTVYKTTDIDGELKYMYLFFRKLDNDGRTPENAESWFLFGKVFFVKKALQYSDFSNIKVGSTISEVHSVDPIINAKVGTDRVFTDPFNSYHLLKDGILRIEYAFDETDGVYRVAVLEYVDSFEIPIAEEEKDTTINVKIAPKDYPIYADENMQ